MRSTTRRWHGLEDGQVQEWWSLGIGDGWRDTVDRLSRLAGRSEGASATGAA